MQKALQDGFNLVSIDTWLVVIPQARAHAPPSSFPSASPRCAALSRRQDAPAPPLRRPATVSRRRAGVAQVIARIHTNNATVRSLIHSLLVKIGRHHPQALMYPLLVATKSQSPGRRAAAFAVSRRALTLRER